MECIKTICMKNLQELSQQPDNGETALEPNQYHQFPCIFLAPPLWQHAV